MRIAPTIHYPHHLSWRFSYRSIVNTVRLSCGAFTILNRWLQGDSKPAKCISCNGCFKPGLEEGVIYCVVEKKEQEQAAKK